MKKKKKLIIILSSTLGAIILCSLAFAACTAFALIPPLFEEETEIETLGVPDHFSQVEEDTVNTSTEQNHIESTESEETDAEEETTDEITEEQTEPEKSPSLSFRSNGNGTCAVTGIGEITDSYITIPLQSPEGDVVTSIDEKAFFGNQHIKAIDIPSTVSDIGDMAFSNCPALIYISVSDDNRSFRDEGGILYNADMSKIIAYPASSGSSTITLPASLRTIASMAFFGCNTLKTINFEGTLDEWSKLNIGDMNYGLYHISIICTDTGK